MLPFNQGHAQSCSGAINNVQCPFALPHNHWPIQAVHNHRPQREATNYTSDLTQKQEAMA